MSRLRLYLDEDIQAQALLAGLRARAVDVVTTSEAGRAVTDDESQLAFATTEGRVLVTCNVVDFPRIHGQWLALEKEHAGIVIVPQQRWPVGQVLARLLALQSALSREQMRSRIEYLGNWRPHFVATESP
jgi:hypothetical protein